MTKARDELEQAKLEIENLKTAASIHSTLATSQPEDGSKSIADQVAEHVAAIRVELDAKHDERVQQNEERFKERAKGMATQLSDKLKDGKVRIRQELSEEHEAALQKLGTEHAQEMEKLQARHKDELDELRRVEESKFAELKATTQHSNQPEPQKEDVATVKTEASGTSGTWQPTDQEIKSLVQNNETIKNLLKGNINKHVNKQKEELTAQFQGERDKALAEAQSKSEVAKDHAVALASKKTSLQVNMATNKFKVAEFKLGIVSSAAQETPQKPVTEVWALAKDAKPPTAAPTVANASSGGQAGLSAAKPPTPVTGTFGRPTPLVPQGQTGPLSTGPAVGRAASADATTQNPPPNVQKTKPEESRPQPQPSAPGGRQPAINPNFVPHPPAGPSQSSQNQHANPGTGPAASRGLSSGIPRGGSTRGNPNSRAVPNQRGRGSGIARGAPQNIDTNRAAQAASQGRGSPNSALNAGARQFVPGGNKRPNDDPQGGDGKRIRGGGGPGRGGQ